MRGGKEHDQRQRHDNHQREFSWSWDPNRARTFCKFVNQFNTVGMNIPGSLRAYQIDPSLELQGEERTVCPRASPDRLTKRKIEKKKKRQKHRENSINSTCDACIQVSTYCSGTEESSYSGRTE